MENKLKSKRKIKNNEKINGGLNPKIVYHETGRIIANPFLKDNFSYYEEK